MTTAQLNGSAAQTVDERTPIVAEAHSPSYRATEAQGEPQSSGSQPRPQEPANSRQRRKAGVEGLTTDHSQQNHDSANALKTNWLWQLFERFKAVELDNKGSTARDHLALERTFLAWLRTSLSFAGIGIAVTQLFRLNTTISDKDGQQPAPDAPANQLRRVGKPLGATFLAVSVIVLLAGWRRYLEAQFYIVKGKFPASRGSIFLATFVAFALIISTFVIVLVVDPSLFQVK